MITVEELRREVLPPETEILGGRSGLDRNVDWATPLRTRPPAFDAVRGGELALVTVGNIRLLDPRLQLADIIGSFAAKGGVAVAIIGEADSASVSLADELQTPLLRLPEGSRAEEMQHVVTRYLLDQRTLLHDISQEMQNRLMQLVLSGAGAGRLVEEIHAITGYPVIWQDLNGKVMHRFPSEAAAGLELAAAQGAVDRWLAGVTSGTHTVPIQRLELSPGTDRLVAAIAGKRGIEGTLSLLVPRHEFRQMARLALERAAPLCALEVDRRQVATAARDEVEGGVLSALLSGGYGSESAIAARALRSGFAVDGKVTALIFSAETARWDAVTVALKSWSAQKKRSLLSGYHAGFYCVLLGDGCEENDAAELYGICAKTLAIPVSGAVGSLRDAPLGAAQSFADARVALQIGQRLGGAQLTDYSKLGLFRLLFSLSDRPALRDFFQEQLGAIMARDRSSHHDLLLTLDAFFSCNCSPTEAAQRLGLHRNTVIYRLRRIEEISGVKLDDPMNRLALHLCLRIGDVLETPGALR